MGRTLSIPFDGFHCKPVREHWNRESLAKSFYSLGVIVVFMSHKNSVDILDVSFDGLQAFLDLLGAEARVDEYLDVWRFYQRGIAG